MDPNIQTIKGTKDILPEDQKYWKFLENTFEKKCESFGYFKIDTPIIENSDLFLKNLNINLADAFELCQDFNPEEQSTKTKKDDNKNAILRPDMTTSIARAYIQHGMKNLPQPVRLYYKGQIFHKDLKNQKTNILNQFGVEIIGDADPFTDATVIFLSYQIMQKLGLAKDMIIDVNSIGCNTCRVKMKKKLIEYFEKFASTLCPNCVENYSTNPLSVLACREEKCQRVMTGAPQLMDLLCTDCKGHFKSVLENLDQLEVPYSLNSKLVKNPDLYTKTIFEFYDSTDTNKQLPLISGGHYDNLLKSLGQTSTPALGFCATSERIIEKMKEKQIEVPYLRLVDICLVQIGEKAQKKCLPLISILEEKGYDVSCILGKEALKDQLAMAAQMKAKIALIIGQREVLDNSIIVRDMEEASQETIKMPKLFDILANKLKRSEQ
jgi:histidyl-tRNA synthetase